MTEPQRNAQGFVVNSSFNPVDGRFGWLKQKVDTIDGRLEPVEKKIDARRRAAIPRLGRTEPTG